MRVVKIGLSVALLACLLDMPYGFYQFIRFLAMMVFAFLAYTSAEKGEHPFAFVYIGLAILFQPVFKISLGRELWNILDVVVAIGLVYSVFRDARESNSEG